MVEILRGDSENIKSIKLIVWIAFFSLQIELCFYFMTRAVGSLKEKVFPVAENFCADNARVSFNQFIDIFYW